MFAGHRIGFRNYKFPDNDGIADESCVIYSLTSSSDLVFVFVIQYLHFMKFGIILSSLCIMLLINLFVED